MPSGAGRVTLLYAAVTVVMSAPLAWRLSTHTLSGGSDLELFLWTLAWDAHALTHAPWAIFDANIFFPFDNTLAYSENLIGSGIVAVPIMVLFDNPVLAMNVVVFLATVLSATGAYVLARTLGLSPSAATIAGLVFGFAPSKFLRIDQVHLATIQWVPFALAFLHAYLDRGRARDLKLAAAFFSLQALTSGHGAAFLLLGGALVIGDRLLRGAPVAPVRRIRDLGWTGALALVPAALIYLPYREAQREVGLRRVLDADWGVSASSFVSSPAYVQQWLLARLPDWSWLRAEPDAWLFPGVLPIVLAIVALAARRSPTDPRDSWRPSRAWPRLALVLELVCAAQILIGFAVVMTGEVWIEAGGVVLLRAHGWQPWLFAAIALGLRLAIRRRAPLDPVSRIRARVEAFRRWRRTATPDDRLLYLAMVLVTLWLAIGPPFGLWQFVYDWPGLSFVRVPSRFTLVGVLGLAVLAGMGFERIARRFDGRSRSIAAAAAAVLLLAEFAAMPLDTRPFVVERPAIDRWLDTQPKPFSVVELPVPDSLSFITRERRNTLYMLHSTAHYQPIFQGYSGIQPPGYTERYIRLMGFPDPISLETILDLGVTYVVVHPELWPEPDRTAALARFEQYRDWLQLVHEEADGAVYVVRRPSDR